MKKIAIISEFNRSGVNYGNRLQAMALNQYLVKEFPEYTVEYLYFNFWDRFLITKAKTIPEKVLGYAKSVQNRLYRLTHCAPGIDKRRALCDLFSEKYMTLAQEAYSWDKLQDKDFDVIIVGSDVVWAQGEGKVGRLRFLDFDTKKSFDRISYAASFGRDWIPNENVKEIKRCLSKFKAISVRENSSVQFLGKYNVNAKHTVDPTLLLGKEEWKKCERQPLGERVPERSGYVFAYLLGTDHKLRDNITKWAKSHNLTLITIPYVSGEKNSTDAKFGDVRISDCSPENWLWLINHADYVITDSFHGCVFSTIFEKKFAVMERVGKININNRMIDFLSMIEQNNKILSYNSLELIDGLEWDYSYINKSLKKEIGYSKKFLSDCLRN